MESREAQADRIEALLGLIERLSAPDLTLAEAEVLRGRVAELLESDDRPAEGEAPASSTAHYPSPCRSDRARPGIWSASVPVLAAG